MALVLGIPIRNQEVFVFEELLPSVYRGIVLPDVIHFWDNSDHGTLSDFIQNEGQSRLAKSMKVLQLPPIKFLVHTQKHNAPLSRAWNTFIHLSEETDTIIISNDDLTFFPNTLQLLRDFDAPFAYPAGARAGNSFSLYKIDKKMWLDVGPFDEQFQPAYFEDNDYHYRMKLKGYDIHPVHAAEYIHVGSGTNKSYTDEQKEELSRWFRRNEAYYIWKHGGKPGQERYKVAFNGKDPEQAIKRFNDRYLMR